MHHKKQVVGNKLLGPTPSMYQLGLIIVSSNTLLIFRQKTMFGNLSDFKAHRGSSLTTNHWVIIIIMSKKQDNAIDHGKEVLQQVIPWMYEKYF